MEKCAALIQADVAVCCRTSPIHRIPAIAAFYFDDIRVFNSDTAYCCSDGWGFSQMSGGNGIGPGPGAIKQQTIGLLHAIAYLRGELQEMRQCCECLEFVSAFPIIGVDDGACVAVPLIAINALVILVKILFG